MQNQEIENTVSNLINEPTLAAFSLQVQATMTTPSRAGKKSRPVWVVTGNVFGLEDFFREIEGRKFRGHWSFFKDPSDYILDHVQNNKRLSYSEQLENAVERKLEKAERYDSYAINAKTRADNSCEKAAGMGSVIPMGQPILVGHYSERRHRKAIERIDRNMQKSVEETQKAEYFSDKARRLSRAGEELESRQFVGNRIADAKKQIAQLSKWADETNPRLVQAKEKLNFWQDRLVNIEANQKEQGRTIASPETVKNGDLVWYIGSWLPVVRVNKKTVTISHWLGIPTFNYKIEYTRISKFQSKPTI